VTLSGPRGRLFEALLRERGLARPAGSTRIPRRADASRAPLSYNQEGLWFLDRLYADGAHYSVPAAIRLDGNLDRAALGRALGEVTRRHDSLRTSFRLGADGQPEQVVAPPSDVQLPFRDFEGDGGAEAALRWVLQESRRPFDLESGPVFRAALLRLGADAHVLWLNMHHIVSDGWSLSIIARELLLLYERFSQGGAMELSQPLPFGDYAAWERTPVHGGDLDVKLRYWTRALEGVADRPLLAPDRPRPSTPSFEGAHVAFELDRQLAAGVRDLSRREELTPFVILQTAFRVLLLHWTGEADTVVGSALANRDLAELQGTVGYFVNTMPLRVTLGRGLSVGKALARVRELTREAAQHQSVPFQRLVAALKPDRTPGKHPLYQVVFDVLTPEHNPAYLGYGLGAPLAGTREAGSLKASPFEFDNGSSRFDLAVFVWVLPDGIRGTAEYSKDVFERATIQSLIDRLQLVISEMTADLTDPLDVMLERLGERLRDAERQRAQAYRATLGGKLRSIRRRPVRA